MKTTLLTLAALLALTASSEAGNYRYGHSYGGGNHGYAGTYGYSRVPSHWLLDRSARVVVAPRHLDGTTGEFEHNTNPNWGQGCRSCADVSK